MKIISLMLLTSIFITGCSSIVIPTTIGDPENAKTYGYHPMDPLPVELKLLGDIDIKETNEHLLNALPDETMRIAIGEFDTKGSLSFGPAAAGVEGKNYIVILDYIKFNTNPLPVILKTDKTTSKTTALLATDLTEANLIVPTYIGVGLRMTANIKVKKGTVDLGNLFALGAAAEAKQISGSLVIQTLGISGENISAIMPMPSEISASTIQNAILALGTMKAKMYENDTHITPRVVGVYNNLGGGADTINAFISSMLQKPQLLKVSNVGS